MRSAALVLLLSPSYGYQSAIVNHAVRHDSSPACRTPPIVLAAKAKKKPAKGKAGGGGAAGGGGFGGGGFGKSGSSMPKSSGPTPEQQLKKAIALYEELEAMKSKQNADAAEELKDEEEDGDEDNSSASEAIASVTKYAVTLRSSAPGANEFCDWVPVAILSLACGKESNPTALMPGAVGATIREILEGGCQAFPSLRKVGRETLEYSFEPLDSFETHVFDGLQGRSDRRKEAAKTLGIESSASAAEVKKAHRKLMQQLHPDMFIGDEKGAEKANERMLEVQEAYGELGGGQGSANQGSFYERIGGKARVDFSGALAKEALAPIGKPRPEQDVAYEKGGWRAGVIPMSTSITQEFVTRNLVRS